MPTLKRYVAYAKNMPCWGKQNNKNNNKQTIKQTVAFTVVSLFCITHSEGNHLSLCDDTQAAYEEAQWEELKYVANSQCGTETCQQPQE